MMGQVLLSRWVAVDSMIALRGGDPSKVYEEP
jgi:hypothetical protein